MDRQTINKLAEFAEDFQRGLEKLKEAAESDSPIALATLNQDECKAVIQAMRDAFVRAGRGTK